MKITYKLLTYQFLLIKIFQLWDTGNFLAVKI